MTAADYSEVILNLRRSQTRRYIEKILNHPIVIAIDGTSASGKSTNARRIAKTLGYAYVVDSVPSAEITHTYSFGVVVGRPLTAHLSGNLGYQFNYWNSNVAGGTYPQNLVTLNLSYAF